MRIRRRFTFTEKDKKIIAFLKKQKLEFNLDSGNDIIRYGTGDVFVYEDDERFNETAAFFERHGQPLNLTFAWCEYTEQEIDEAEWLMINAWHNGYPQPSDNMGYLHTTYESSKCCNVCYRDCVQKDSFILKKKPKWGRKNFFELYWVHDELFISNRVVSAFENNNVKGIEFYDVLYGLKKREVINDTKQLFIKSRLKPGLRTPIREDFVCSACGLVNHILKAGYVCFDKNVFDGIDVDVIKTSERFGADGKGINYILVTQRLRKIITDNKLENGIKFTPVQLV